MASTIRTFIAVPLPAGVLRSVNGLVKSLQRRFPEYRWQEQDQMHITVNFLGEIPDARVADVCQAVTQVAGRHGSFAGNLTALGAFPKPGRPRILWLGIGEGQSRMVRLHHDLAEAFESLNIEPEPKRFRPHLTLGRIRSHERWPDAIIDELNSENPPALTGESTFEVEELVVYSSFLEPTGPVHTPMSRAQLGRLTSE